MKHHVKQPSSLIGKGLELNVRSADVRNIIGSVTKNNFNAKHVHFEQLCEAGHF